MNKRPSHVRLVKTRTQCPCNLPCCIKKTERLYPTRRVGTSGKCRLTRSVDHSFEDDRTQMVCSASVNFPGKQARIVAGCAYWMQVTLHDELTGQYAPWLSASSFAYLACRGEEAIFSLQIDLRRLRIAMSYARKMNSGTPAFWSRWVSRLGPSSARVWTTASLTEQ